jgi:membrane protease subunit (stomatin/prohibitin family)
MGLFSRLFSEFVDVIEWTDDSSNTMVSRFERYGNEIKYGAKLIVREAQFAVFVNEGEVADVLGPGTYELETKNLPILTTLQNWHHGFESPFKAEVYFCNARRFTDLKWGTKQPLMLRDSEFGGLRIRAFGTYGVRITDALLFIREIVGTEGVFTTDEISSQLRNLITSRFATIIGSSNIPVLDMAANYDQLGDFLTKRIAPELGMTGNLDRYIQYQSGASMEAAAQNPGGGASDGIGMGIGLAMANQMSNNMQRSGGAGSPPPMPGSVATVYHVVIDGAARGPYTVELLMEHVARGSLKPDTLVWSPNLDQWQPANSVESLDSIWGAAYLTPPPIPKA